MFKIAQKYTNKAINSCLFILMLYLCNTFKLTFNKTVKGSNHVVGILLFCNL